MWVMSEVVTYSSPCCPNVWDTAAISAPATEGKAVNTPSDGRGQTGNMPHYSRVIPRNVQEESQRQSRAPVSFYFSLTNDTQLRDGG